MADHVNSILIRIDGGQAKTEADAVNQKFDGIGDAGKKAGANVSTGMAGIDKAVRSSGSSLSGYEKAAKSASQVTAQYEREILSARVELAQLSQRIVDAADKHGKNSAQVQSLRSEYQQLSAATRGMVAEKTLLVAEEKAEEAAVTSASSAWSRKTSIINTGQGVLRGYDAAIQGVIRSVGGIQLGWAVLISLGASLLPLLANLGEKKKEIVLIGQEEIATNELIALSYERLGRHAFIAAEGTIAFQQNAQLVTEANIAVTLMGIANAQQEVEKESGKVAAAFQAIELARTSEDWSGLADVVGMASQQIKDSSLSIAENQKKAAEGVATMRMLRDVFGLSTDQLIEFASRAGATQDKLDAVRRAINSDIDSLRQFAEELGKATNRAFNLEQAALRLSIALKEIKPPRISIEGLKGIEGAKESFDRAHQLVAGAPRIGSTLDSAKVTMALKEETHSLIETMKEQAAASAKSQAEARRLFETYKNQLSPAQREQVQNVERMKENLNGLSESKSRGAGAARAYANELINLTQRANQAEAALVGSTFGQRERMIREETEALRRHLEINKRDKAAALAEINRMERAQIAGVAQARDDAEQQLQDRIRQIEISGIADERQRRLAQINFEIEQEQRKLNRMFDDDIAIFLAIDDFKRALIGQFNRWETEENKKALERKMEQERRFMETLEDERLKRDKKVLDNFVKEMKRVADVANSFTRRGSGPIDQRDIQNAATRLKSLGMTVEDVGRIFGRTTSDMAVFNKQLDLLEKFKSPQQLNRALTQFHRLFGQGSKDAKLFGQQVDFVNGKLTEQQAALVILKTGFEQFKEEWIESGEIFLRVADGISSAFEGLIANGENFGAAMKAMMLNLIADMAAHWGKYFILKGAGIILFDPGRGAALIAAGTALLALAGVLRGFAGKIQQSARQGASGGGGGTSAAESGSSGGTSGIGGGSGGSFTGERSKFSPGAEFSGSARITEIDRRIRVLDALADRVKFNSFERALRRQIEMLEAERRALSAVGTAITRDIARVTRVPINTTGLSATQPRFDINVHFDTEGTARIVVGALEGAGVMTVGSLDGRHRQAVRRKMKKM